MLYQTPEKRGARRVFGVIKHLAGLLLGVVAAELLLWCLLVAVGALRVDLAVLLVGLALGLCSAGGAIALLWRKAEAPAASPCPACGHGEHAPAGVLVTGNPWLMIFGGFLLASLWGESRRRQVRCMACDHLFHVESRGTRLAGILLWILLIIVFLDLVSRMWMGDATQ